MNVKNTKKYQLMAEPYSRAEVLYNTLLTFINVANSKLVNFSMGCLKYF